MANCPPIRFISTTLVSAEGFGDSSTALPSSATSENPVSVGGDWGGDGAQYFDRERWVWTSGGAGILYAVGGAADGTGDSLRVVESPMCCAAYFGKTQFRGPVGCAVVEATPKALLISEDGDELRCLRPAMVVVAVY